MLNDPCHASITAFSQAANWINCEEKKWKKEGQWLSEWIHYSHNKN